MTRVTVDVAVAGGLLAHRVWLVGTEVSVIGAVDVVVLAAQVGLLTVVATATATAWRAEGRQGG